MSRDLTNTLATAQALHRRYPLARATVRDVRLRFAQFTTQANPYGKTDAQIVGSEDGVCGDQIVTPGGKILRVITDGSTTYANRATAGTAASWATWANLGQAMLANTQPGLVISGTDIYLFFVDAGNNLAWRKSTDDGASFGVATTTGLGLATGCTIAPITKDLLYVCQEQGTGANARLVFYRVVNSAGWTIATAPWRIFGNNAADAAWVSSGHTYFDAFTLNGADYLIVSDISRGFGKVVQYKAGCWSTPRWLLPDDYTVFRPYRVSVIQSRVWLTGRFIRNDASGWSPALDVYLYSDDGMNWTALSRDSYLGADEVRGKLHLPGDGYVYYSGIYRVQRAPATYLIDPAGDLPANKVVLTNDIVGLGLEYSAAGMAPQVEVDLAAAKNDYFTGAASQIVKPGSDVMVELGYKTTAGDELIPMFRGNIDSPPTSLADGERSVGFSARDIGYKQLKDWDSALYWELNSQRKKHDECDNMNGFALDSGVWYTGGPNLVVDPGFEAGTGNWIDYATGPGGIGTPVATGTRVRTQKDAADGEWSYQLTKLTGADTARFGSKISFAALAGKTYNVSLDVRCSAISGGSLKYTLTAMGNYGKAGAAASVTTSLTDSISIFETMALTVVCEVSATVTVFNYLDDCTTGTLYIDNAMIQDASPGYLSTREQDAEQLLFTLDENVTDFDIRGRFADLATSPASLVGVGVVGLAIDADNLIYLQLSRAGVTGHLGLFKKRAGNWTRLTEVGATFTSDGVYYDVRLVHRGGHFWGWTKAATATDWGAPLIDYTWTDNTDKPCNSDDGKGRLGVRVRIQPLRFHAYGLDEYSTVVCLRANNDLDFNSFPISGTRELLWEGERITYTSKTGSGVIPIASGVQYMADTSWQMCSKDVSHLACILSQPPYSWGHYVVLNNTPGASDNLYNNYGLIFPSGGEPYAAWQITSFKYGKDGHRPTDSQLTTDGNSGHANTNGQASGAPNWHVYSGPNVTCQITPALYGCTRGANGTKAIRHTDNSLVYQYADDQVYLDSFESFDMAEDWSNESALRRICAMAGVTSLKDANGKETFDSREHKPSTVTIVSPGTWTHTAIKDWNNNNFNLQHFEIAFDCSPLGDGEGIGASWVGAKTMFVQYTNAGGYVAGVGPGNPANDAWDKHKLPIQPVAGASLHFRIIIAGAFATLYINDMWAWTYYDYLPVGGNGTITLAAHAANAQFTNIHIPDLMEWREFAQVNEGESAQESIGRLLEDRPIYQTSKVGVPRFSTFEQRNDLGAFTDVFFTDEAQPEDTEIFTFPRVEAEEIIEKVDDTLARTYGLIHRRMSMQTATTPIAALMLDNMMRRMQGTAFGRSQELVALLNWEPEDRFAANFTTSGARTTIAENLIVNDVKYEFKPAELSMSVTARRYV